MLGLHLVCKIAGKASVAVIDQIRAVTKERLQQKLGAITVRELGAIENGLREVLEL